MHFIAVAFGHLFFFMSWFYHILRDLARRIFIFSHSEKCNLKCCTLRKRDPAPLCRPSSVAATPYLAIFSPLLPFSFSLLSHFHPRTTYSLSFNCVLAIFRLLRKARRLHSLLTKILYPYSLTLQLSLLSANSFPTLLPSLSFLSSLLPSLTPSPLPPSLDHSLYNLF